MKNDFRVEHDFLGDRRVPNNVYYGVQTLRAAENFHISGIKMYHEPNFIIAFAEVKKAAALANHECGALVIEKRDAIIFACDEIIKGRYHDQFVTDLIQGGAGTSVNMNVNEVISNIGLEYLKHNKGDYDELHPNNDVNLSQSTNDAYPTAVRLALTKKIVEYNKQLGELRDAFAEKAKEHERTLKMGRTQLQDAVPMTLGMEFNSYATGIQKDMDRLEEARDLMDVVNMGGTAIGTGINAAEGFSAHCVKHLAEITGQPISLAADLIAASYDTSDFVEMSGLLKRSAVRLSKICNDLRLLASGPRAGLFEINLPKMQPGSSIMPGKVNPVIPEVVNQTAFYVIGMDTTVTMAAEAGQLELNVMEPVLAFALFTSFSYMANAVDTLTERCVKGITANVDICANYALNSIGIVTSLNPILGYEVCAGIAKEASMYNKSIHDIVVTEKQLITQEKWDEIYSVDNMIDPEWITEKK